MFKRDLLKQINEHLCEDTVKLWQDKIDELILKTAAYRNKTNVFGIIFNGERYFHSEALRKYNRIQLTLLKNDSFLYLPEMYMEEFIKSKENLEARKISQKGMYTALCNLLSITNNPVAIYMIISEFFTTKELDNIYNAIFYKMPEKLPDDISEVMEEHEVALLANTKKDFKKVIDKFRFKNAIF